MPSLAQRWFENGKQKGVEQGIVIGVQQGMQQGMQQALEETAIKLLESGQTPEFVAQITGLSKKRIKELSK